MYIYIDTTFTCMCLQYIHIMWLMSSCHLFCRLFMVHGQAAHRPDLNRISECVALRLYKEFREARNRPKDNKGKTFAIPQSIVMTYSHIKQLIEDCKDILDNTNLLLVTINNTTVSSWLVHIYSFIHSLQYENLLVHTR